MRYAGIIKNDVSAAPGVCVSFFTQGCPHRCHGCHNPETWDYEGGKEFTADTILEVLNALTANGVERSFCIMGGEPLCPNNLSITSMLIEEVRKHFPDKPIFVWTGYTMEELNSYKRGNDNNKEGKALRYILNNINCLIDGRYEEDKRDITLVMRGSANQNIYYFD